MMRSERYQQIMRVAEEYYKVLQEAKSTNSQQVQQLKRKLDQLIEPYSDDVAYHAFLKMERQAARLGDNKIVPKQGHYSFFYSYNKLIIYRFIGFRYHSKLIITSFHQFS